MQELTDNIFQYIGCTLYIRDGILRYHLVSYVFLKDELNVFGIQGLLHVLNDTFLAQPVVFTLQVNTIITLRLAAMRWMLIERKMCEDYITGVDDYVHW